MPRLNSHDDFTPLKEVIVGSAANYLSHERDVSFELFHHENLSGFRSDWAYPRLTKAAAGHRESWAIKARYAEELHEDVEALAAVLAGLGTVVHRPLPLPPEAPPIAGLGWEAAPTPALNIRDNTLILGDEIIETPPAIRSRYLETRLLAPVFTRYWEAGARWTTMPRPTLTDNSFDLSYARDTATTLGGPTEAVDDPQPSPYDVGVEMMLDGAQVLRLGRDLVVNVAQANHARGAEWLQRHLGERYRVHRVWRMADNHIDSMVLALKPGVFLARHDGIRDLMPERLRSWRYIVPPEPDAGAFPVYDDYEDLVLTSPYIDLNVLSVDENTVLVNEDCTGLAKTLDAAGFTTVPVRHRHRRLFGGGFHCFTLDTVREGTREDYLA
ncbi:glycine amidinotransferase [Streptomyces sp. SID4946]|uniref:glycine amidinotransferase n=1 Tax=Streptomyces sp. LamerLS-31b TaxID=1839765 RepID=UPI00081F6E6C|nr:MULTISPECIES: glycine amidinotransferase [unclassified Streptomyces]MYQ96673.1 glycine amidinotransferase [Streptomyces sp. SID4946]SCF98471.1 glycine amidinotransferase [Streptomyces sp. LamerLS-31b]SCG01565.1 glycine amidinotransferase [Streptomyces sp. DconLS]